MTLPLRTFSFITVSVSLVLLWKQQILDSRIYFPLVSGMKTSHLWLSQKNCWVWKNPLKPFIFPPPYRQGAADFAFKRGVYVPPATTSQVGHCVLIGGNFSPQRFIFRIRGACIGFSVPIGQRAQPFLSASKYSATPSNACERILKSNFPKLSKDYLFRVRPTSLNMVCMNLVRPCWDSYSWFYHWP